MSPSPLPYDNSIYGFQPSSYNPGDICWVPKPDKVDPALLATYSIPEGALGHPILIFSSPDMGESYFAFIMTNIRGKDLQTYSLSSRIRRAYYPIHPAPANPESGSLLYLENLSTCLPKQTYVNTSAIYRIPRSLINSPYHHKSTGTPFRLSMESFAEMQFQLNLPLPTAYPFAIQQQFYAPELHSWGPQPIDNSLAEALNYPGLPLSDAYWMIQNQFSTQPDYCQPDDGSAGTTQPIYSCHFYNSHTSEPWGSPVLSGLVSA